MEDVLQLSVTRVLSEEVLSCTQANLFYPAEISVLQKTTLKPKKLKYHHLITETDTLNQKRKSFYLTWVLVLNGKALSLYAKKYVEVTDKHNLTF